MPGNVRELINSLQHLLIIGGETSISVAEIDDVLSSDTPGGNSHMSNDIATLPTYLDDDLRSARDAFEKMYFEHHLKTLSGNVSALAKVSGLERTHLYRKFKALDINPKDWK